MSDAGRATEEEVIAFKRSIRETMGIPGLKPSWKKQILRIIDSGRTIYDTSEIDFFKRNIENIAGIQHREHLQIEAAKESKKERV